MHPLGNSHGCCLEEWGPRLCPLEQRWVRVFRGERMVRKWGFLGGRGRGVPWENLLQEVTATTNPLYKTGWGDWQWQQLSLLLGEDKRAKGSITLLKRNTKTPMLPTLKWDLIFPRNEGHLLQKSLDICVLDALGIKVTGENGPLGARSHGLGRPSVLNLMPKFWERHILESRECLQTTFKWALCSTHLVRWLPDTLGVLKWARQAGRCWHPDLSCGHRRTQPDEGWQHAVSTREDTRGSSLRTQWPSWHSSTVGTGEPEASSKEDPILNLDGSVLWEAKQILHRSERQTLAFISELGMWWFSLFKTQKAPWIFHFALSNSLHRTENKSTVQCDS